MAILAALVRAIGGLNRIVGMAVSWLSLGVVLVCFTVVVERYVFSATQIWMQDLYVWLGGAMFTAVAGFALLRNDHVRVDIFYRPASTRWKAVADLIGVLAFLIPYCVVIFVYGLPYVARSWQLHEGSENVGGMPGLFVLKSFVLIYVALVGLQGVAMAARSILVLAGEERRLPPALGYEPPGGRG